MWKVCFFSGTVSKKTTTTIKKQHLYEIKINTGASQ